MKVRRKKKQGYHHGDLRAALIEAAIDLIDRKGIRGFSLAEASRSLGVSVGAPFRHFTDRDELLVAVAIRACHILACLLEKEMDSSAKSIEQLATLAHIFVRFSALHHPLYVTLFAAGLNKDRKDLATAAKSIEIAFLGPAKLICQREDDALQLVVAIIAVARGFAELLHDGAFGTGEEAMKVAELRAHSAARALIAGRQRLRSSQSK